MTAPDHGPTVVPGGLERLADAVRELRQESPRHAGRVIRFELDEDSTAHLVNGRGDVMPFASDWTLRVDVAAAPDRRAALQVILDKLARELA